MEVTNPNLISSTSYNGVNRTPTVTILALQGQTPALPDGVVDQSVVTNFRELTSKAFSPRISIYDLVIPTLLLTSCKLPDWTSVKVAGWTPTEWVLVIGILAITLPNMFGSGKQQPNAEKIDPPRPPDQTS